MTDARRARCKDCGGHRDEVGLLSWRGYCGTCGPKRAHEAAADLHYHQGEKFTRWREGMARCVGALLVDEVLRDD